MADDPLILLVRGEATRMVEPDQATLSGSVSATLPSRTEALRGVAAAQQTLVAALAALGGVRDDPDQARAALTWSMPSARTNDETDGQGQLTGRVVASLHFDVRVRELRLLDQVWAAVAAQPHAAVGHVNWEADQENPGWAAVRKDAVRAGVTRARAYAAALGSALEAVEQLADAGLGGRAGQARAAATAYSLSEPDAPSLDPQPQALSATVELRVRATSARLGA